MSRELGYEINKDTGICILREQLLLPTSRIPVENLKHLQESTTSVPDVIYPMFRALTADKVTRNKTFYKKETLAGDSRKKTGIYSAISPYPIPYIKDHATGGMGETSEVYGRAINAFMVEDAKGGSACNIILGVPHPHAIEQITNGNWLTVSMGSRTEEATCSICEADLIKDPCEHNPWDNEDFHTIIGPKGFKYREISNVLMPSDTEAIKQSTNVDPLSYKMFAGTKESVYNLMDPTRKNLLEGASPEDKIAVESILQSKWLLDEFVTPRKRYFLFQESYRSQKEKSMAELTKNSLIDTEKVTELTDLSFGVLYQDETSQKTLRRFPMSSDMTSEQKEFVKLQIENAKDLDAEQRETLQTRLADKECVGDPIQIQITEKNYTHLLDIIDSLTDEMSVRERLLKVVEVVETEKVPEKVPEETKVETPTESTTPVPTLVLDPKIVQLTEDLQKEHSLRVRLQAEKIARQQIAIGDAMVKGKSLEQLISFYTEKDPIVLDTIEEMLAPTFDQVHIDVTNVEKVKNPVEELSTTVINKDTTPVVSEDLSSFINIFGAGSYLEAKETESIFD